MTTTKTASEESGNPGMSRREFEAFIDKPEVARRLNKTLRTVDNWMQRGLLP